ncbi:MAG TPA: sigma-54 factor interaction domain-containing protein, partial [Longimicrobiaceae bacterium]|nr:sigma-54 factor interaction domain-containing protein [Longimicrobiaceae bacterium]
MPILTILPLTEAFGTLWPQLAEEVGAELRIARSVAEFPRPGDALPPLLVIAGAEDQALSEVRAIAAAGHRPLVVGADRDHRFAISLLRSGAADYFALPHDLEPLRASVTGAAEALGRGRINGGRRPSDPTAYDFGEIIGRSPALRATLERAARIIPHDAASVLLTGETGTGKELLARAIHFNGPRAAGAFVEINCAAIPAGLLESELFGYERGAFTDARNPKPGLFEAADRGTLFLDEIGHMPLVVQGKLLKALEEKRIRRLGSVRQQEVDVRIIAATHVELEEAIRAGEFREDLYYRLAVI